MAKIAIAGQISEVMRELALRRNVYPSRVGAGKMRQAEADLCITRMEAVLETLRFCQRHGEEFRAWLTEKKAATSSIASDETLASSPEGAAR